MELATHYDNTEIKTVQDETSVKLWGTEIVKFNNDEIKLNTGGYLTATTIRRMNEVSREYKLDFGVSKAKGKLSVRFNGVEFATVKGQIYINRKQGMITD